MSGFSMYNCIPTYCYCYYYTLRYVPYRYVPFFLHWATFPAKYLLFMPTFKKSRTNSTFYAEKTILSRGFTWLNVVLFWSFRPQEKEEVYLQWSISIFIFLVALFEFVHCLIPFLSPKPTFKATLKLNFDISHKHHEKMILSKF